MFFKTLSLKHTKIMGCSNRKFISKKRKFMAKSAKALGENELNFAGGAWLMVSWIVKVYLSGVKVFTVG